MTRTVNGGVVRDKSAWPMLVARTIAEMLGELGEEEIAGIGLGVPGAVNPHTSRLVPPLLYPWASEDRPGEALMDTLRTSKVQVTAPKVLLDNDANLAAVAESVYRFPEAEVLLAVMASSGINGGIVIEGKPFPGRTGSAGEIGHVAIREDGDFCPCGGRGCLETIVGGDALLQQVRIGLGVERSAPGSLEELVAMAKGKDGEDGDVVCRRVLTEAAAMLGWVVGSTCNVLNPQVVVLGGAFGAAKEITLDPFKYGLRRTVMRAVRALQSSDDFVVRASDLPHAVAQGALVLAIDGVGREEQQDSD